MTVYIKPGKRNEELIEEVRKKKAESTQEEWEDFIDFKVAENEDLMDALYYADEKQGKWALKEQARYFTDLLLWDERNYFAYRLGNLEIDF